MVNQAPEALDRMMAPKLAEAMRSEFVRSARVGLTFVTRRMFTSVRLYRIDVQLESGWEVSGFCDHAGEVFRVEGAKHPTCRRLVVLPEHEALLPRRC